MGVDEASARAFVEQDLPAPQLVRVLPENRLAVQVFLATCNAWLYHPVSGQPLALLRGEVMSTMQLMNVKPKRRGDTFDRLRAVEQAALEGMRVKG